MRRRLMMNTGEVTLDPIATMANYMTIEALEDGLTASLSESDCEYCINADGAWVSLSAGTASPALNAGDIISFRNASEDPYANYGIGTFTITGTCNLHGNCMSLLYGDDAHLYDSVPERAFYYLFQNCTTIVEVADNFLPAKTLATYCYNRMFSGCTSLTKAPALPATTLATYCYYYMFSSCKALTTAPALPAKTLTDFCYFCMFNGCTSLTSAPVLPATTLLAYCYNSMFNTCTKLKYVKAMFLTTPGTNYTHDWLKSVASSGTFVKSAAAEWDLSGTDGVPEGWTIDLDGSGLDIEDTSTYFFIDGSGVNKIYFRKGDTWGDFVDRNYGRFTGSGVSQAYYDGNSIIYQNGEYCLRGEAIKNGYTYKLFA